MDRGPKRHRRLRRDSVVVNDFVHLKPIVLHAGQSYLANKP